VKSAGFPHSIADRRRNGATAGCRDIHGVALSPKIGTAKLRADVGHVGRGLSFPHAVPFTGPSEDVNRGFPFVAGASVGDVEGCPGYALRLDEIVIADDLRFTGDRLLSAA